MWLSWLSPNFSKETLWRLMEWYFNVTSNEQYQNCDVKVIAYTEIVLFFCYNVQATLWRRSIPLRATGKTKSLQG